MYRETKYVFVHFIIGSNLLKMAHVSYTMWFSCLYYL